MPMQRDPFARKQGPPKPKRERQPTRAELDKRAEKLFKGRCIGCGFLGKRSWALNMPIEAVDYKRRDAGELWLADDGVTNAQPWCAKGTVNLLRESVAVIMARPDGHVIKDRPVVDAELREATVQVLADKERQCRDWGPNWDGFTPMEHLDIERSNLMHADGGFHLGHFDPRGQRARDD